MRAARESGAATGGTIGRCMNCGAERASDLCEACGLPSATAEVLLRRRLLNLTAIFLLGAVAFLAACQSYPPLELDGILIFIGVVFFLTLGLAISLDRRARRHAELELLRRLYLALVPVPWLLAALLFVNGRFDFSPPVRRSTSVVGKFTMPGTLRSSRLVVISWRQGRRIERVPVARVDYDRFQRGDLVDVEVQEGLVGIPWVYNVYRK